jgi:hypothetical protein
MGMKFGILAGDNPDALPEVSRVEVRESLGEMITYTVVFSEDVCDNDFKLLTSQLLLPWKEIKIWVEPDNKGKVYLARGPIKGHQIKLVNGGQGSEIQVKGTDNSVKMKLKEKKIVHKEKDSAIVSHILSNNGFKNPKVKKFDLTNEEAKHSKLQNQDDLSLIKSIAHEHSVYFWITYNSEGEEEANFNELPLAESPGVCLVLNHDDVTKVNIDEFSISWDADVPTKVVGNHLGAKKKDKLEGTIETPPQDKLGSVTLAALTKDFQQEAKATARPADDSGRVQQRGKGALNEAEWFIKANCSTSFDKLCKVIHAHTVVKVIGAGSRHSGKYVVSGVTHTIDSSSYKMQLELMRNAWD